MRGAPRRTGGRPGPAPHWPPPPREGPSCARGTGAAPRGEIGRCRALARGGEGSGGEARAQSGSLQPALPCPLPRCGRHSVALCARSASRKLCPKKSSPASLPSRSGAPPPPGPRAGLRGPPARVPATPRRARSVARMRYADPSANRDLLGNRTLLFIFICAFALVTLLQQILYGRNYIKR